jgi:glucose-6-phosphate 1-epimerase
MNGLPKVRIQSADGAAAEVYLHGAHLTSWIPAGGEEQIFLSPRADFQPGSAIRGGVPVIFPQFADVGPLPKHGFARVMPWELAESGSDRVLLRLEDSDASRAIWPHHFLAEFSARVWGSELEMILAVTNTGERPLRFTGALHTYLKVEDVREAVVTGLEGLIYRDSAAGAVESEQVDDKVSFPGEVDRVYLGAQSSLQLIHKGGTVRVSARGFADAVIWNPGPQKCAKLADMEPDGYLRFVCVEAAAVREPLILWPGETWQGTQKLKRMK